MAKKLTDKIRQVQIVKKMKEVSIGRWFYRKPDLVPNRDGNIVLILMMSFGPLETYEWGIDSNKNAYEHYRWLENDFFADESYRINIEREKLLAQLHSVISLFRDNGLPEWADLYERVIVNLDTEQMI